MSRAGCGYSFLRILKQTVCTREAQLRDRPTDHDMGTHTALGLLAWSSSATEHGEGHEQALLQVRHEPGRVEDGAPPRSKVPRSWPPGGRSGICVPSFLDCPAPAVQPAVATLPDEPCGNFLIVTGGGGAGL